MKRLFICSFLLSCYLFLIANPMGFLIVSEYWLNAENEMLVELCPSYPNNPPDIPLSNIQFTYNGLTAVIPNTTDSLTYGSPLVINMSELNPPLIYNSWEGGPISVSLINSGEYYYEGEQFEGFPGPGNSYVHCYSSADMGSWYWAMETPPTPGLYPYFPQSRGTLRVYCHDQFGNPIPNVHLIVSPGGYIITDINGIAQVTTYCCSYTIYAHYPELWHDLVYTTQTGVQINETTQIDIPISVVANEDPTALPVANTGLKIYPVPFNQKQNSDLCFQLPKNMKKSRQAKLKIYNAKGQFVTELKFPKEGLLRWQPDKDTSSGVYTVRLLCDNRIVETTHFSLLK